MNKNKQNNKNLSSYERFLEELFDSKPSGVYFNIWTAPNKKSKFFKNIDKAAGYIDKIVDKDFDIYIQTGMTGQNLGSKRRGKKKEIIGLPGFYMDIDVAGSAHENKNLPPTVDAAIKLVMGHGIDPTLIVNSGHGLHVWWLFKEALIFDGEEEQNEAEMMNHRLQETVKQHAKEHGWELDATFDLTRLLRIVGTYNRKEPECPILVQLIENTGVRYASVEDFDEFVVPVDTLNFSKPVNIEQITLIAKDIVLNPSAVPPADMLQELIDANPKFKKSWEGNRHDMKKNTPSEHAFSLATLAVQANWNNQQIADLIIAFYRNQQNNPRFPDIDSQKALRLDFIPGIIAKVMANAASPDGAPFSSKIKINVDDHDLPKATELAFKALNQTNDPKILFNMENKIIRLEISDNRRPSVKLLQVSDIRHELTRRADCYKINAKKKAVPKYPNTIFCEDILSTSLPPLPELTAIKEHPHYSLGSTFCFVPGYYDFSKCYYHESSGMTLPPCSANPTASEIDKAKHLLFEELLKDFPFVSEADKINSLSMLILPYVRNMIEGSTPLHCVTAPDAGTGKTLLVRVLATAVLGYEPDMISPCGSDEEWRKQITAKLINLPEFFIVDNVDKKLDNAPLSKVLTSSAWEDRYLRKSLMIRCPVECVFIATGNNMTYSTEISRRIIPIRLDTKVEKPWLRDSNKFKHYPLEPWVKNSRGQLVWAVLTIINNWLSAGKPKPKKLKNIIGSYEAYCHVIGGIFEAAGIVGFMDNLLDFYEESDHESQVLGDFVRDWWDNYKGTEVIVSDLLEMVEQNGTPLPLGDGTDHSKKIRLGNYLEQNRNRHCRNFKIIKGKKLSGRTRWRLEISNLKSVGSKSDAKNINPSV